MSIKQLSIFISNKTGKLAEVTGYFYKEGFDIRALSAYDTEEYGIVRIIVDDPDRAKVALKSHGVMAQLGEVLAIKPEDEKGQLYRIFSILGDNGIDVEYVYSVLLEKGGAQYFVFEVSDIAKAESVLCERGISII